MDETDKRIVEAVGFALVLTFYCVDCMCFIAEEIFGYKKRRK